MRRFSQRNSLVTLSDINITPLLDLAFVLLIIFIITTPLLQDHGLELNLPKGGQPDPPLRQEDFRTVEVGKGFYLLNGVRFNLAGLKKELEKYLQFNPELKIFIRADKTTPFDDVFQVTDYCADLSIPVSLRSEAKTQ